jgi:hypothetical protein
MNRLEAFVGASMVGVVTFLVTEWVHYRVGNPPIFERLLGPRVDFDSTSAARGSGSVTEAEFQTYVRVLEAMQANRALSIEDAVAAEHIPLPEFRDLEQRVQRNELLIDRARSILRERAESLWNHRLAPLEHG